MAIDADEDFLHEILGAIAIPDRPIDEIQETRLISVHQLVECTRLAGQVSAYKRGVIRAPELVANREPDLEPLAASLDCKLGHMNTLVRRMTGVSIRPG